MPGNATHLGLFTTMGRINFTPGPNNPAIVHTSGEAILTASDGDKLIMVNTEGQMDVSTGIAIGKFRFEGGTGGSRMPQAPLRLSFNKTW